MKTATFTFSVINHVDIYPQIVVIKEDNNLLEIDDVNDFLTDLLEKDDSKSDGVYRIKINVEQELLYEMPEDEEKSKE